MPAGLARFGIQKFLTSAFVQTFSIWRSDGRGIVLAQPDIDYLNTCYCALEAGCHERYVENVGESRSPAAVIRALTPWEVL